MSLLKTIFSSCFAILLMASSNLAIAQPETGSRIDRSREGMTGYHDPKAQKSARAGINALAKCRAENQRARAMKTLSYRYLSDEQAKSLKVIFKKISYDDRCSLAKDIKFGYSTAPIVGAFSEFFLLRKYSQSDVAHLSKLTDLDWQNDIMSPRNANELFGRCVVRKETDKVYALINTVPDTADESAAIKSIVPALGPCVTDGLEVSFDKTSLRAILAYGLYRSVYQHAEMLKAES